MATFFGEILPLTSRAVDDDDDEEDDVAATPQSRPVCCWTSSFTEEVQRLAGKKIPCRILVIALGAEANAFTDIYIRHSDYDKLGEVCESCENGDSVHSSRRSSRETSCCIYRHSSKQETFVCQCHVNVLPEQSFVWGKLLVDSFELSSADIVVLSSSGMGSYCSDLPFSELETPFLRFLSTERGPRLSECGALEQPNMVTGLPAQLMTMFQVYGYRAMLYVCFKGNRYLSVADIKAFCPVLCSAPLKDIIKANKNTEQLLRDVVRLHSENDLMYM